MQVAAPSSEYVPAEQGMQVVWLLASGELPAVQEVYAAGMLASTKNTRSICMLGAKQFILLVIEARPASLHAGVNK